MVESLSNTGESKSYFDRIEELMVDKVLIRYLTEDDLPKVISLIRKNLGDFDEAGGVLAASYRRLDRMLETYSQEGACFLVALDANAEIVIGAAGLGPLAGLPKSEGICEIRELVLDSNYRGRGIGTKILRHCLEDAKHFGYTRIYLETTPQMENAQRLFKKFGFRPVTSAPGTKTKDKDPEKLPCYFLLEDITLALTKGT